MSAIILPSKLVHPAKFNPKLVPVIDRMLGGVRMKVLDPFAGTGWIFDALPHYDWTGIEIEQWPKMHPLVQQGNALDLPFRDETFDAVVTSPSFGNRMADHHVARDDSKRNTYRHTLGRPLHADNTGQYHFGLYYQNMHHYAWKEVWRVLQPGGVFVLNLKNFIKRGHEVDIISWHRGKLHTLGFTLVGEETVPLKGNRFGQNGKLRVNHEWVGRFVKGV